MLDRMARLPNTLPPPYSSVGMRSASPSPENDISTITTTTTLHIGPEPHTTFTLHTHLLTASSPYFRAALTGPFIESTTQTLTLPDLDPAIFTLFTTWLYTSHISPLPFKDGKPAYYTLLHLYILADRLCVEALRNKIVDTIADLADRTNSVLTPSDTRLLYTALPATSPIRKLVLDLFAFKKTERLLESHTDEWHAQFLRDLVVHLKKPCKQAWERHSIHPWVLATWCQSRGCEGCGRVLMPHRAAAWCEMCARAWCLGCVGKGEGVAGWEDGGSGVAVLKVEDGEFGDKGMLGAQAKWEACKPWRGSRCRVYHEHRESRRCGEVFMGR